VKSSGLAQLGFCTPQFTLGFVLGLLGGDDVFSERGVGGLGGGQVALCCGDSVLPISTSDVAFVEPRTSRRSPRQA
jgi:hypothetical protein